MTVAQFGPVPKRTDQRRRRNKTEPVTTIAAGGTTSAPPLREGLDPLAVQWYESLSRSAQSRFYEPSDWAYAQLLAESVHEFAERPSANMLKALTSAMAVLLVTEGDRRRMRVELERTAGEAETGAKVVDYRSRLA